MTSVQQDLQPVAATSGTVEALILDVGHGNSAILREGDRCVIVDAKTDKMLYQALVESGVRRIEHLVLSHADTDHIAGALRILPNREFEVGTVWANADSTKDSMKWGELLALLADLADSGICKVRIGISNADRDDLSLERVGIRILHPTLRDIGHGTGEAGKVRPEITTNGMSVVLQVNLDGRPALFLPGDVDAVGFRQIVARADLGSAPVLVYPHHGGHSGSALESDFADELCMTIKPEVVVFSMGRGNYENPLREVVERIRDSFPFIRMACTQLSRQCHPSVPMQTDRGHLNLYPASGRASGTCCAGSVRVRAVAGEIVVDPDVDAHRAWIGQLHDPMCIKKRDVPKARKSQN
ncbi:MBL fold metallo-hydrolase [Streptomyces sp. NBC_01201]|uniref:ComEC/Rec2 family competence protein n=1 Tax=Streptomyces sp. NBC_01201 TaxID=2903770 RepID=UPI00099734D5|nr:MBL fold metallo-hydrolase [Streptomyces sp. NBC_01201]WSR49159.1 MBL fold metallo-hydrolase [Streptomyces sp. NBC_01201]